MSDVNEKWYQKSFHTDKYVKEFIDTNPIFKKSIDTSTVFRTLLSSILDKPFWVKQALYLELRDDIGRLTNIDLLKNYTRSDLLQLYVPKLNHLGECILNDPILVNKYNVSADLNYFLSYIDGDLNVIDLCYKQSWSLEYFAQRIIEAFDKDLIEPLQAKRIHFIFQYLAGQLDIAHLLVKLNKITDEQLYKAKKFHDQMSKTFDDGEVESLESVLVRLNYVDQDRIDSLSVLKSASTSVLEDTSSGAVDELKTINHEFIQSLSEDNKKITDIIEDYEFKIHKKDAVIKSQEEEILRLQKELENQSGLNFFKKL